MLCPKCGNDLPAQARFCQNCGAVVESAPTASPEAALSGAAYPAAVSSAGKANGGRWPVSTGILSLIAFLFTVASCICLVIFYQSVGAVGYLPSVILNVLAPLALTVLFFVPTRRIPFLTALPRAVPLLFLLGRTLFISVRAGGMNLTPTFLISVLFDLALFVIYLVAVLTKPKSPVLAIVYLVLTVVSCLYAIPAAFFGRPLYMLLISNLVDVVATILTGVAYCVALFSLTKSAPASSAASPAFTGAAPASQAGTLYAPPASQTPDAPSGGAAALGFFFPMIGLILYLTWQKETPLKAKSAGKGALFGVITSFVVTLLLNVILTVFLTK